MSHASAKSHLGPTARRWLWAGGGLLLGAAVALLAVWAYVAWGPAEFWGAAPVARDEGGPTLQRLDQAAPALSARPAGLAENLPRVASATSKADTSSARSPASATATAGAPSAAAASGGEMIELAPNDWSPSGVRVEPSSYAIFTPHVLVTGTVALNEDRVAHVYPLSEGILREVRVRLGDRVEQGQTLATVDSQEVGAAKLGLVQNRLDYKLAEAHHTWDREIQTNTQQLIDMIHQGVPIAELEQRLRDQPMGDYRQQLITAYAQAMQYATDYQRLSRLKEQQIAVEKEYLRARSESESASATLQALLEQIKFDAQHNLLTSQFQLEEASTRQRVGEAQLLILGFKLDQVQAMDPLADGEAISHYPVQAPLSGTVIDKHAVLNEHVQPEMQLFQVADLSTVWIHAHVFEKDLAALDRLADMELEFRAAALPEQRFAARVLYTGDMVAEETRTVKLLAQADNPSGRLKPGMFVEIHIPLEPDREVLQVPADAVLAHGGESFVFVAHGERRFERRVIETGRSHEGQIEVVSGLAPGEPVVVAGGFALKSEWLRELIGGE